MNVRQILIFVCAIVVLTLSNSPSRATAGATHVGPNEQTYGFWYAGGAYYLSTSGGFYRSLDASSWIKIHAVRTSGGSLAVLPTGEIYIFGYDSYELSTDNGSSWRTVTQDGFSTRTVVVDSTGTLFAGQNDPVYISHDKGATWIKTNPGASPNFFDVSAFFLAPDGSLFAGNQGITGGYLYRTTDHGAHWRLMHAEQMSDVASVEVYPTTSIILRYYDKTLRSDDNGATWSTISTSAGAAYPHSAVFQYESIGFALVPGGKVVGTIDGGETWDSTTSYFDRASFTALYRGKPGELFAASNEGLYKLEFTANVNVPSAQPPFVLYPNPSTKSVTIVVTSSARPTHVAIYDAVGRCVLSQAATTQADCVLPTDQLPAGTYHVVIDADSGHTTSSLSVVH